MSLVAGNLQALHMLLIEVYTLQRHNSHEDYVEMIDNNSLFNTVKLMAISTYAALGHALDALLSKISDTSSTLGVSSTLLCASALKTTPNTFNLDLISPQQGDVTTYGGAVITDKPHFKAMLQASATSAGVGANDLIGIKISGTLLNPYVWNESATFVATGALELVFESSSGQILPITNVQTSMAISLPLNESTGVPSFGILDLQLGYKSQHRMPVTDLNILVFKCMVPSQAKFVAEVTPQFTDVPVSVMIKLDARPVMNNYWKQDDRIVEVDIQNNVIHEEVTHGSTTHPMLNYSISTSADSFIIYGEIQNTSSAHTVLIALVPSHIYKEEVFVTPQDSMNVGLQASGRALSCMSWKNDVQSWTSTECSVLGNTQSNITCACPSLPGIFGVSVQSVTSSVSPLGYVPTISYYYLVYVTDFLTAGNITDMLSTAMTRTINGEDSVAVLDLLAIAQILNHDESRQADQVLTGQEIAQFRKTILEIMEILQIRVATVDQVKGQADVLHHFTLYSSSLDSSCQVNSTRLYEDLGKKMKGIVISQGAPETAETIKETAMSMLLGAMRVLHVISTEIMELRSSNTIEGFEEIINAGENEMLEKARLVTTGFFSLLDYASDSILYLRTVHDTPIYINDSSTSVYLHKLDAANTAITNVTLESEYGTAEFAFSDGQAIQDMLTDAARAVGLPNASINVQAYSTKENTYVWDSSSAALNVPVQGLQLRLPFDGAIGLTSPVHITFPVSYNLTGQVFGLLQLQLGHQLTVSDLNILVFNFTVPSDTMFRAEVTPQFTDVPLTIMIKFDERPLMTNFWSNDEKKVEIDIKNHAISETAQGLMTHPMLSYNISIGTSSESFVIFGQNKNTSNVHTLVVAMIPSHISEQRVFTTQENSMNVSLHALVGNCMSWKNDTQLWTHTECSMIESTQSTVKCACPHLPGIFGAREHPHISYTPSLMSYYYMLEATNFHSAEYITVMLNTAKTRNVDGDDNVAALDLLMIAQILNHDESRQGDQVLSQQELSQFTNTILGILEMMQMRVNTLSQIEEYQKVLYQITTYSASLDVACQINSTRMYKDLGKKMKDLVMTEGTPEIAEEVKETAISMLLGAMELMGVISSEIQLLRASTTVKGLVEVIEEGENDLLEKARVVTTDFFKLLDYASDSILYLRTIYDTPIYINDSSTFIYLNKINATRNTLSNVILESQVGTVQFAFNESQTIQDLLVNATVSAGLLDTSVNVQAYLTKVNTYVWDSSGAELNTPMQGFEFKLPSGEPINLTSPLYITFPVDDTVQAIGILQLQLGYRLPATDLNILVFNFTVSSETMFRVDVVPYFTDIPLLIMIKFDERPVLKNYWRGNDRIVEVDIQHQTVKEEMPYGSTTHPMLNYSCSISPSNNGFTIFGQNKNTSSAHAVLVSMIPLHVFKEEEFATEEDSMNVSFRALAVGNCMSWKNSAQLWTDTECSMLQSTPATFKCACPRLPGKFGVRLQPEMSQVLPLGYVPLISYYYLLNVTDYTSAGNITRLLNDARKRATDMEDDVAVLDLLIVAQILNHDESRDADQVLSAEELSQFRSTILQILDIMQTRINEFANIVAFKNVLHEVTTYSSSLDFSCQVNSTRWYKDLENKLRELVIEVGIPESAKIAKEAAISMLHGAMELMGVISSEIQLLRASTTVKGLVEVIEEGENDLLEKARVVTTDFFKLLDYASDSILYLRTIYDTPIYINDSSTFIYLNKINATRNTLSNVILESQVGTVQFAFNESQTIQDLLVNATVSAGLLDTSVNVQAYLTKVNTYVWDSSGAELNTPMQGFEFKLPSGEPINLTSPLYITFPVDDTVQAIGILQLQLGYRLPATDLNILVFNFIVSSETMFRVDVVPYFTDIPLLIMIKFDERPVLKNYWRGNDRIVEVDIQHQTVKDEVPYGSTTHPMLNYSCSISPSNNGFTIFGQNKNTSSAHAVLVSMIPLHVFKEEEYATEEDSMNVSFSALAVGNCMSWKNSAQLWTDTECSMLQSTPATFKCACPRLPGKFGVRLQPVMSQVLPLGYVPLISFYYLLNVMDYTSAGNITRLLNDARKRATDMEDDVAVLDLLIVAQILNHDESRDADQVLSAEELSQFRSTILQILDIMQTRINEFANIVAFTNVLHEVTTYSSSLDFSCQVNSTRWYKDLGNKLRELVIEVGIPESAEIAKEAAISILRGAMRVLNVISSQILELRSSITIDSFVEIIEEGGNENLEKTRLVTNDFFSLLDHISDSILHQRTANDTPIYVNDTMTSIFLNKVDAAESSIANVSISSEEESTEFAFKDCQKIQDLLINATVSAGLSDTSIHVQAYSTRENIYAWDSSVAELNTPMQGLDLRLPTQEVIELLDMTSPLYITLPVNQSIMMATVGNLSLLPSTQKPKEKDILVFKYDVGPRRSYKAQILPDKILPLSLLVRFDSRPQVTDFTSEIGGIVEVDFQTTGRLIISSDPKTGLSPGIDYASVETSDNVSTIVIFGFNVEYTNRTAYIGILPYYIVHEGETKPAEVVLDKVEVRMESFTGSCLYWSEQSGAWLQDGCWMLPVSTPSMVTCACSHLTKFAASFLVEPNEVDLIGDIKLMSFAAFFDNPVVVCLVSFIWAVYALLTVWGRRQDKLDQEKIGVVVLEDNNPKWTYGYMVLVQTAWKSDAGTSSNVGLYLEGTRGRSESHVLKDPTNQPRLQAGGEDCFLLTARTSLGDLRKIFVWHDCTGAFPAWFLTQIIVKDLQVGVTWYFVCNDWMTPIKGYDSIHRCLVASSSSCKQQFSYVFSAKTDQDLRDKHLWVSIFTRPPQTTFTRPQRLACALCFIMTAMLTNMMFYGKNDDPAHQLGIGDFKFSFTTILIGIESALVSIPINMLLITLFRAVPPRPEHLPTSNDSTLEESSDSGGSVVAESPEFKTPFSSSTSETISPELHSPRTDSSTTSLESPDSASKQDLQLQDDASADGFWTPFPSTVELPAAASEKLKIPSGIFHDCKDDDSQQNLTKEDSDHWGKDFKQVSGDTDEAGRNGEFSDGFWTPHSSDVKIRKFETSRDELPNLQHLDDAFSDGFWTPHSSDVQLQKPGTSRDKMPGASFASIQEESPEVKHKSCKENISAHDASSAFFTKTDSHLTSLENSDSQPSVQHLDDGFKDGFWTPHSSDVQLEEAGTSRDEISGASFASIQEESPETKQKSSKENVSPHDAPSALFMKTDSNKTSLENSDSRPSVQHLDDGFKDGFWTPHSSEVQLEKPGTSRDEMPGPSFASMQEESQVPPLDKKDKPSKENPATHDDISALSMTPVPSDVQLQKSRSSKQEMHESSFASLLQESLVDPQEMKEDNGEATVPVSDVRSREGVIADRYHTPLPSDVQLEKPGSSKQEMQDTSFASLQEESEVEQLEITEETKEEELSVHDVSSADFLSPVESDESITPRDNDHPASNINNNTNVNNRLGDSESLPSKMNTTLLTLKPESLSNIVAQEETSHRSSDAGSRTSGSTASFLSPTTSLPSSEDFPPEQEAAKEESRCSRICRLPWWFIYIAWALAICSSAFCSYVLILYGLRFGYALSVEWLISFFTTFTQNAFLFQPLKVMAVACVVALVNSTPVTPLHSWVNLEKGKPLGEGEKYLSKIIKQKRHPKPQLSDIHLYFPPTPEAIEEAKMRLLREHHFRRLITDMIIYLLFLGTLMSIVFGNLVPNAYLSNKSAQDMFVTAQYEGDFGLSDVSRVDDVWAYLEGTFLPCLHSDTTDGAYTADMVSVLVGLPRLRQLRLNKDTQCTRTPLISDLYGKRCHDAYTASKEDKGSYGVGWVPLNTAESDPGTTMWTYQSSIQLKTSVIVGQHASYSGGGFVAEISEIGEPINNTITDLKADGWIDANTKALFVELTLYNPSVNLFNIVTIIFEFLQTGQVQATYNIMTPQFFYATTAIQVTSVVAEILYVIFVSVFSVREFKRFLRLRKDYAYFKDVWSYVEIIVVLLSLACVAAFIARSLVLQEVMEEYRASGGQKYVSFYTAGMWDYVVTYLSASLLVIAMLKFTRLLQFNKRILLLSSVLRRAFPKIVAFGILFLAAMVSYVILVISLVGSDCEDFSTLSGTILNLFSLALMELTFDPETSCASTRSSYILVPLYVMFIGTLLMAIWIPLLQAILDYVTTICRKNVNKSLQDEIDMMNYIHHRISFYMSGLIGRRQYHKEDKKRK